MTRLDEYINAVLLNNPSAVAEHLMQLGVLQGEVHDPEVLKHSLLHYLHTQGDRGAFALVQALDVPVNYAGAGADQLMRYHAMQGNRAAMMALVAELLGEQDLSSPAKDIRISSAVLLQGLTILLLFVLTIFLIRKM